MVGEYPYDEPTPHPDQMEAWIDFAPLERIAKRPFDAGERLDIAIAAWRVYSVRRRPMAWRTWERLGGPGVEGIFRLLKRGSTVLSPLDRVRSGARGYPELNVAILFLQRRLRIGKYTTRDTYDEASDADVNLIEGPFVDFVVELVGQIRPHVHLRLPEARALPRHIKQVFESMPRQ